MLLAAAGVFALGSGCGARQGAAEPLEGASAVEATFGDAWCRRIEDPQAVAALVAARNALGGQWQPAWTPLQQPGLTLRYFEASGELEHLGLGDGQVQSRVEGRQVFRPIDQASAARLVALAGGPPTGPPDHPCSTGAAPSDEPPPY